VVEVAITWPDGGMANLTVYPHPTRNPTRILTWDYLSGDNVVLSGFMTTNLLAPPQSVEQVELAPGVSGFSGLNVAWPLVQWKDGRLHAVLFTWRSLLRCAVAQYPMCPCGKSLKRRTYDAGGDI
jgi:hypothetical protein